MNQLQVLEVIVNAIRSCTLVAIRKKGYSTAKVFQPCAVGAPISGTRVVLVYAKPKKGRKPTGDEWQLIPLAHIDAAVASPFPGESCPPGYEWEHGRVGRALEKLPLPDSN